MGLLSWLGLIMLSRQGQFVKKKHGKFGENPYFYLKLSNRIICVQWFSKYC